MSGAELSTKAPEWGKGMPTLIAEYIAESPPSVAPPMSTSRPRARMAGYTPSLRIDGYEVRRADLLPWVAALPDAVLLRELRVVSGRW
jgi:hypothetical protein